jgi:hypothetical protein
VLRWQQLRKQWLVTEEYARPWASGSSGGSAGATGGAAFAALLSGGGLTDCCGPPTLPQDAPAATRLLGGCWQAGAAVRGAERRVANALLPSAVLVPSGTRAAAQGGAAPPAAARGSDDCGPRLGSAARTDQILTPDWRAQLRDETDACLQTLQLSGHARSSLAIGSGGGPSVFGHAQQAGLYCGAQGGGSSTSGRRLASAAVHLQSALAFAHLASAPLAQMGRRALTEAAASAAAATKAAAAEVVPAAPHHLAVSSRQAAGDDSSREDTGGMDAAEDAADREALAIKLRRLHARRRAAQHLKAWAAAACGVGVRSAGVAAALAAARRRRILAAWHAVCPCADPAAAHAAATRWRIAADFHSLYCLHACLAAWRRLGCERAAARAAAEATCAALEAQRREQEARLQREQQVRIEVGARPLICCARCACTGGKATAAK